MYRIWITGSSGSGKTTIANKLGNKLNIPVYHRDRITWKENWQERSEKEQIEIIKEISEKDKWIFDGNKFSASKNDGRFDNCDMIIHININRFLCLYRGVRRYLKHRHHTRPEFSEGCYEEYNMEAIKYVLFGYPKKKYERQLLFNEARKLGKEVIILNGRKEVRAWCNKLNL
ncbi:AAA family ATPase [Mycoplasmatota bacterium]|nr:AAA family ATPase [Mycoplasmatota bacterium]